MNGGKKMKKNLMVMAAVCLVSLVPLRVNAQICTDEIQGYSTRAISDGICHCGHPREKKLLSRITMEVCPEHGATCDDYYGYWSAWYYYCTNSACGDNYQDKWTLMYYEHQ